MISEAESNAWKPGLEGWSTDILQFYSDIVPQLPDAPVCVELGVYAGRSLSYLVESFRQHNRGARIVGIDWWNGDMYIKCLSEFIKHCPEHVNSVQLLRWKTAQAARLFEDQSCDLVFIDADHEYEGVKQDITAWLSKVKTGGIIAGHDFTWYPGVARAVADVFGKDFTRPVGSVWMARL